MAGRRLRLNVSEAPNLTGRCGPTRPDLEFQVSTYAIPDQPTNPARRIARLPTFFLVNSIGLFKEVAVGVLRPAGLGSESLCRLSVDTQPPQDRPPSKLGIAAPTLTRTRGSPLTTPHADASAGDWKRKAGQGARKAAKACPALHIHHTTNGERPRLVLHHWTPIHLCVSWLLGSIQLPSTVSDYNLLIAHLSWLSWWSKRLTSSQSRFATLIGSFAHDHCQCGLAVKVGST